MILFDLRVRLDHEVAAMAHGVGGAGWRALYVNLRGEAPVINDSDLKSAVRAGDRPGLLGHTKERCAQSTPLFLWNSRR